MSETTKKSLSLSPDQAEWLAQRLQMGTDYLAFGSQYVFFLSESQWAEWLPKLPPPAAISDVRPMLTYGEKDGWTFQFGADGKPVPGTFEFVRFRMGKQSEPAVSYTSGGFNGTRCLRGQSQDDVRTLLLTLGFIEETAKR